MRQPSAKQLFLAERAAGQHAAYDRYSPDYAWRLYRNRDSGLSRSQIRGHARAAKDEVPISVLRAKPTYDKHYRSQHRIISRNMRYYKQIPDIIAVHALDATAVNVVFHVEYTDGDSISASTKTVSLKQSLAGVMKTLYDGKFGITDIMSKYGIRQAYAQGHRVTFDVRFREEL